MSSRSRSAPGWVDGEGESARADDERPRAHGPEAGTCVALVLAAALGLAFGLSDDPHAASAPARHAWGT